MVKVFVTLEDSEKERKEATGRTWLELLMLGIDTAEKRMVEKAEEAKA